MNWKIQELANSGYPDNGDLTVQEKLTNRVDLNWRTREHVKSSGEPFCPIPTNCCLLQLSSSHSGLTMCFTTDMAVRNLTVRVTLLATKWVMFWLTSGTSPPNAYNLWKERKARDRTEACLEYQREVPHQSLGQYWPFIIYFEGWYGQIILFVICVHYMSSYKVCFRKSLWLRQDKRKDYLRRCVILMHICLLF